LWADESAPRPRSAAMITPDVASLHPGYARFYRVIRFVILTPMTHLSGKITTKRGAHRLHDHLYNFLVSLSSLCIAFQILKHGRNYPDFAPGTNATIDSFQFDMRVKVPNFEPLLVALDDRHPDAIEIEFLRGRESPLRVGDPVPFQRILLNLMAPIFVQFFEDYKHWIDATFGNTDNWPEIFNFARLVRNAFSHGNRLTIWNESAKPARWHNLTYDHSHHNRPIGLDLTIGDILILMFEMNDELDIRRAPIP
jgi:hypothetical protein